MNDAGIEAAAKGQNTRQEKNPARWNRIVPTTATMMFRINAVGFMTAVEIPNRAIAARYPDAPACPTVEYRRATAKMSAAIMSAMTIAESIADLCARDSDATNESIAIMLSQRTHLLQCRAARYNSNPRIVNSKSSRSDQ